VSGGADESADSAASAEGDDSSAADGQFRVGRRRLLLGGGSVAAVGGGRAIHNVVLGYGRVGGTNLLEQDLDALVGESIRPTYDETVEGYRIVADGEALYAGTEAKLSFADDTPEDAAAVDADLDLGGRIEAAFEDLRHLRRGQFSFEFYQPGAFFERVAGEPFRPDAVAAIRGHRDRTVDPGTVGQFADVDPADVEGLVDGLVGGFREHTRYDLPRYIAGAIEDNVLLGAADLRRHFEGDVSFEALLEGGTTGIFCWELVYRSIEALQARSPFEQSIPTAACYVSDRRHKHAFTGVATAVPGEDGLTIPMTFVDYTHTTMYDDARLTWLLGEGLKAYNDGHRADELYW